MDSEERQRFEIFLGELDGMLESTEEFIADDRITADNDPEGRLGDRYSLLRVKNLYLDVFAPGAPVDTDGNPKEN